MNAKTNYFSKLVLLAWIKNYLDTRINELLSRNWALNYYEIPNVDYQ